MSKSAGSLKGTTEKFISDKVARFENLALYCLYCYLYTKHGWSKASDLEYPPQEIDVYKFYQLYKQDEAAVALAKDNAAKMKSAATMGSEIDKFIKGTRGVDYYDDTKAFLEMAGYCKYVSQLYRNMSGEISSFLLSLSDIDSFVWGEAYQLIGYWRAKTARSRKNQKSVSVRIVKKEKKKAELAEMIKRVPLTDKKAFQKLLNHAAGHFGCTENNIRNLIKDLNLEK